MNRTFYDVKPGGSTETSLSSSNHDNTQLYLRINKPTIPTDMLLEADSLHCSQALKVKGLKKSSPCQVSPRRSKRSPLKKCVNDMLEADSLHCSKTNLVRRSSKTQPVSSDEESDAGKQTIGLYGKRRSAPRIPAQFLETDSLHCSRSRLNKGPALQPFVSMYEEDSESESSLEERNFLRFGEMSAKLIEAVSDDDFEADSLHCTSIQTLKEKKRMEAGNDKRRAPRNTKSKQDIISGWLEADSLHYSKARIMKEKESGHSIPAESQSSAESDNDSYVFQFDGIKALGTSNNNAMADRLQLMRQNSLLSLSSFASSSSHHQPCLTSFCDDDDDTSFSMDF